MSSDILVLRLDGNLSLQNIFQVETAIYKVRTLARTSPFQMEGFTNEL